MPVNPAVSSMSAPSANPDGLRLAMVAGEASGDLLAGMLLTDLRRRWPALRSWGVGGPRMVEQGFDAWWSSERLAVRGYVEVLRHYRALVAMRDTLGRRLLGPDRPEVFVGVDAPDFNLVLEERLRRGGVRTVHFVCPAIWAWRAERVDQIRRSADHVLCIFPFEPALLERHGIASTYVGHPLAEVIPINPNRAAARARLGLSEAVTVLAVLPGSRAAEVAHLAHRFLAAAALLRRQRPDLRVVVPTLPGLRLAVEGAARRVGLEAPTLMIVNGRSHDVLEACDLTLIASGTATLEAALFKRPMVIGYHMNALSWLITRRKMLQPWVGLPNILCEDFVVPECLQERAQPQAMASALARWLEQPDEVQKLQARFTDLHEALRRPTAQLASDAIEAQCRA